MTPLVLLANDVDDGRGLILPLSTKGVVDEDGRPAHPLRPPQKKNMSPQNSKLKTIKIDVL